MSTLDAHRQRLTRNTAYLTVASIGQKLLSSAYYLIFPNIVGTGPAGAYFFAISFANIFSIVADAGMSPLIIREVARAPETARATFRKAIRLKLFLALVAIGVIWLLAPLLVAEGLRRQLLVFTTLVMISESLSLTMYGIMRGLQRLRYEAIGATAHQLTVLAVGTTSLLITRNPLWLGVTLFIASVVNVAYASWALHRAWRGLPNQPVQWQWRSLTPFLLSGGLTRLYAYVDVVILGLLASDHVVGLYGTATKLAYTLQFLPIAFNASLYPALSQAYRESRDTLGALVDRSIRLLLILSAPLVILLSIFARPLLALAVPAFVDAAPALQISVLSLPCLFLNFLWSSLLNATDRPSKTTWTLVGVVITNVTLSVIFIPQLQHVGASIAAFGATTMYTILGWRFAREFVHISRETRQRLGRLVLVGSLTVIVGFALRPLAPVYIAGPLAAGVFLAGLFLGKVVLRHELRELSGAFRRGGGSA